MKEVYLNIKKDGEVWIVDGQLEAQGPRDLLDLVMILMTTAVRLSLRATGVKNTKALNKALTAQLKDIVDVEAEEVRRERSNHSNEEDA